MHRCGATTPLRLIELGSRANIEGVLESSRADLVISVRGTHYSKSLQTQEFLSDNLACFYDPKFRGPIETTSEYVAANHAVVDFGSGKKSIVDSTLEASLLERNIRIFASNIEALAHLMRGTDMVATMPSKLKFSAFSEFAVCPPPISFPNVNVDMIWHRRTEHTGRGLWIRDLVMSTLPKDAGAADGNWATVVSSSARNATSD